MLKWRISEVTVTRVPELEAPTSPRFLFGRSKLLNIGWLQPYFVNEQGDMLMSIHALIVESQGVRIMVDTCLGNDKVRKVPASSMRQGPFLEDLRQARFAPERGTSRR